jgi:hypothetical protein
MQGTAPDFLLLLDALPPKACSGRFDPVTNDRL